MVIVLALVISTAWAQEVVIKSELDTNKALIGDQIKLRLSVEKQADIQVDFPALKDTITHDIEIVSKSSIDTTSVASERFLLSQELLISVFDTGLYEIPSLAFIMQKGTKQDTLHTLPVKFEILSVKSDSTIRDIKAIYKVPMSFRELSPYILITIVLGLLIWLLIHYLKNRHNNDKVEPVANSSEPPDIVALRALEQLKEEKPWIHGKVKFYHIMISEILRTYIERRFDIMALEQTTDEILIALKPPVCKAFDHNRLSEILKLADLVKFAKVIPGVNENAAQVDLASEFVCNTTVHEAT
jgi:hypothetical protein